MGKALRYSTGEGLRKRYGQCGKNRGKRKKGKLASGQEWRNK